MGLLIGATREEDGELNRLNSRGSMETGFNVAGVMSGLPSSLVGRKKEKKSGSDLGCPRFSGQHCTVPESGNFPMDP